MADGLARGSSRTPEVPPQRTSKGSDDQAQKPSTAVVVFTRTPSSVQAWRAKL